ncbi:MAG: alcohol dehydrogenase, partial [Verrucomicrobia bacterium]
MSHWKFQNPVEIRFGSGCLRTVEEMLPDAGSLLLVTTAGGRRRPAVKDLIDRLAPERLVMIDDVEPNPTLQRLEEQIGRLVDLDVRVVVAVGGGS